MLVGGAYGLTVQMCPELVVFAAVFLDVPKPWEAVESAAVAMKVSPPSLCS